MKLNKGIIALMSGMLLASGAARAETYCREYTETITVGGQQRQGYGTACMQPDGSWEKQTVVQPVLPPQAQVQITRPQPHLVMPVHSREYRIPNRSLIQDHYARPLPLWPFQLMLGIQPTFDDRYHSRCRHGKRHPGRGHAYGKWKRHPHDYRF